MIKKILLCFILVVLVGSISAVNKIDLEKVLISSLQEYYENPLDSKLNPDELRDLLDFYFISYGKWEVDLYKTGSNSGKEIGEIYEKASLSGKDIVKETQENDPAKKCIFPFGFPCVFQ